MSDAKLKRALGPWSAGAFVVTSMVGAGIFTVPAFVRAAAGALPYGVVRRWSWPAPSWRGQR